MKVEQTHELPNGQCGYDIRSADGENLVFQDLRVEIARPRGIRLAGVAFHGRSIGRLLEPSRQDSQYLVISSEWPKRIVDAAVDSYLNVRSAIGRIDNCLTASRPLVFGLVLEPLSDMACARLDRNWREEYKALSRLIGRSDVFRSEAVRYDTRRALLGQYLNILYDATKGRYGVSRHSSGTSSSSRRKR